MNDSLMMQNQRQYQRMHEALASIQSDQDTGSLGSLIATLDFLLEALEKCDAGWKGRFRKQWGILEEVNAFVLDSGRKSFSENERKLINGAVNDLKLMVEEVSKPAVR